MMRVKLTVRRMGAPANYVNQPNYYPSRRSYK